MSANSIQALASVTYDYVIAGGGTAGLVLANRLSDNPFIRVAVIEGGADHRNDSSVQWLAAVRQQLGNATYDSLFRAQGHTNLNNRTIAVPSGQQLGGSSAMSFGFWDPLVHQDFDDWADLGNPGWAWKDFSPYVIKAESFANRSSLASSSSGPSAMPNLESDPFNSSVAPRNGHGLQGPIKTTFNLPYSQAQKKWAESFRDFGLSSMNNSYANLEVGAFQTATTQDISNSQRSFSANAYLNFSGVSSRPNLVILTSARIDRIVLNTKIQGAGPTNVTATGVQCNVGGKNWVFNAQREVILSAGAIQTPRLLELSGIGNASRLNQYGIPSAVDLPGVGENLQDHPQISLGFQVADGVKTTDYLNNAGVLVPAVQNQSDSASNSLRLSADSLKAFLSYQALLTAGNLNDSLPAQDGAYHPTGDNTSSLPYQALDLQYSFIAQKIFNAKRPSLSLNLRSSAFQLAPSDSATNIFANPDNASYISLTGSLMYPFSRGSIHINSSSSVESPAIDLGTISSSLDSTYLGSVALIIQKLAQNTTLSSLLKRNGTVLAPNQKGITSSNSTDFVRSNVNSAYDLAGSCAMLPRSGGGVVNNRLLVYGTRNLRIVDASIIPLIPASGLLPVVYGIAEKAADMIKADDSSRRRRRWRG